LEGTTFKLHLNSLCEDGTGPGLETVGGEFQPSFETVYPGAGAHHSFFVAVTGLQSPMRFKPPYCNRLQGAADARRRARRRPFVLQVPDNKADAVPCERLPFFHVDSMR
jgi:hypothetical protein